MKTSSAGLAFIAQEEGTVLHVYNDVAGYPTVGIGHLLTDVEKTSGVFAKGITKQQALDLLASDVVVYESAVNKNVKVPLTQNQFDALVSFTFNLGVGALASSGLLTKLNKNDYEGAADEFLKWCKAVIDGKLQTNVGLLHRRQRERALFLKPAPMSNDVPVEAPSPPVSKEEVEPDVVVVTEPQVVTSPTVEVTSTSSFQAFINFVLALLKAFFGRGK